MTAQVTCMNEGRKYGMNSFQKNWFTEIGNLDESFAWSMRVNKILHQQKTEQDIIVFESERFGRCLALDDYIQWTENDGFVFEEMAAFLSLNSHINPKKVLVIGGVYAGVVREITKHPLVQSIVICEPNEEIIKVCKKFLPGIAKGFESSKLTVNTEDPEQYLKRCKEEFDIIITDLPDPAESVSAILETTSCFKSVKDALKSDGIFVSQVETFWFDVQKSRECLDICTTMFSAVDYATMFAPSVPAGQRGILLCAKSPNTNFRKPIRKFSKETLKDYQLKYYTPDIHRAAFALPYSIHKDLGVKLELHLQ